MPFISVIIPTYNRADLLKQALDSLATQTFRDFETIVVDDGSRDHTSEVIPAHSTGCQYIVINHSGLPAVARNAGIKVARGEWIAFLDSDDTWLPDKLQKQVEVLKRFPAIGLLCTNAYVTSDSPVAPGNRLYFTEHAHQGMKNIVELIQDNFVITSTMLVRRSLIISTGAFSENPRLRAIEDYDLWLRLASYSDINFLDEGLATYHDSAQSLRSEQSLENYWRGIILIFDRLRPYLVSRNLADPILFNQIERRLFHAQRSLLSVCLKNHNLFGAMDSTWRLAVKHPYLSATELGRILKTRMIKGKVPTVLKENGFPNQKKRLHLGCGETYLEGYVNIDFPPSEHTVQRISRADLYADIVTLRYEPGSIDEIRLHHVFEHFDRVTALFLLVNWYQWLEPGGKLVIETPDFQACSNHFVLTRSPSKQFKLMRHLYGSNEAAWAVHQDGWSADKFKLVLSSLGFRDIRFIHGHWKGIYNITAFARKGSPSLTRVEQTGQVAKLLRLNLVDDSPTEIQLLKVWMDKFNRLISDLN